EQPHRSDARLDHGAGEEPGHATGPRTATATAHAGSRPAATDKRFACLLYVAPLRSARTRRHAVARRSCGGLWWRRCAAGCDAGMLQADRSDQQKHEKLAQNFRSAVELFEQLSKRSQRVQSTFMQD